MTGDYYWNIHVTPEKDFSYASFETNYPKGSKERGKIERSVRNDYIENLRNNCYQETLHGNLFSFDDILEILLF